MEDKMIFTILIGLVLFTDQPKKTDVYHLARTLLKHSTVINRYQLRLITNKNIIYGPDCIAVSRPQPSKTVLSFNSFVNNLDLEINRIEIYDDTGNFLHSIDYSPPIKLKKLKEINFYFTLELNIKMEHKIR